MAGNIKAFQSNANPPLSNSLCFIVNKFEDVQGILYSEVQVEQFETWTSIITNLKERFHRGSNMASGGRGESGPKPCTTRSKLNKFQHVWGAGPCTEGARVRILCRGVARAWASHFKTKKIHITSLG